MNSRFLKVLVVTVSVVSSIAIASVIFGFLGVDDEALKITCIAFMCSAFTLDLNQRLASRFGAPGAKAVR